MATLIDDLIGGDSLEEVAKARSVSMTQLCCELFSPSFFRAMRAVMMARRIERAIAIDRCRGAALSRLIAIAIDPDSLGYGRDVNGVRMLDCTRKACVEILRHYPCEELLGLPRGRRSSNRSAAGHGTRTSGRTPVHRSHPPRARCEARMQSRRREAARAESRQVPSAVSPAASSTQPQPSPLDRERSELEPYVGHLRFLDVDESQAPEATELLPRPFEEEDFLRVFHQSLPWSVLQDPARPTSTATEQLTTAMYDQVNEQAEHEVTTILDPDFMTNWRDEESPDIEGDCDLRHDHRADDEIDEAEGDPAPHEPRLRIDFSSDRPNADFVADRIRHQEPIKRAPASGAHRRGLVDGGSSISQDRGPPAPHAT